MFKLLHRAVFQAHVTAGLFTSGYIVHRLVTTWSKGSPSPCPLLCVFIQRYRQERDEQEEGKMAKGGTWQNIKQCVQTTLVTTGAFAFVGATWWFSYPLAWYLTQHKTNRDWAKTIIGSYMR